MHLLAMILFAAFVAVVFGTVGPETTTRGKVLLGLRTWGEFMGIGLLLAWLLYFIPWGR